MSSADATVTEVDILIVGFGFSVITLLRELEKSGHDNYTLISEGKTIWEHLHDNDKLHFDLVSSYVTSVLTEDQVANPAAEDYFPTARWYYEYHMRIMEPFRDKVVKGRVCRVENYSSYSMAYTDDGRVYKATNIVFGTGFNRPHNDVLKTLDVKGITNKTVVFNMIGDSTNMMLSWLVPQDNKVILLNNGMVTLDKFVAFDIPGPKSNWYIPTAGVRTGKSYRLDTSQMEAHPIGIYFPFFYSSWIRHPWVQDDTVTRWTMGDMFHLKFPQTYRKEDVMQNFRAKAGVGNGIVAIKYYPIDMYRLRYGSDGKDVLEERIKEGVVLNDIAYWHMEGLVESWSKKTTIIDQENNAITGSDGRVVSYDVLIEGGIPESPNLPPIHIMGDDGKKNHEFVYRYRESFLGVVPRTLHKNIFFLGLTRPTTGGIANMVEMQGLMVHKLLTQPKLLADLKETIEERVDQYNVYYYPEDRDETPTDHLVFYGFYTHEVAKFMGIDRLQNLWDNIKSWNPRSFVMNLRFELLTTNNAFKFRMDGEYCIEGAKEMALKYFEHFEHQAVLMYINANLLWDLLLGYVFLYMLLLQNNTDLQNATNHLSTLIGLDSSNTSSLVKWNHPDVSSSIARVVISMAAFFGGCYLWYTKAPTIANQTFSLPVPMFGLKATFQPLFLVYTALYGSIYWLPTWFSGLALIGFLSRQVHIPPVSGRYLFNDTKHKHKHQMFYQEYKALYQKVHRMQQQQ